MMVDIYRLTRLGGPILALAIILLLHLKPEWVFPFMFLLISGLLILAVVLRFVVTNKLTEENLDVGMSLGKTYRITNISEFFGAFFLFVLFFLNKGSEPIIWQEILFLSTYLLFVFLVILKITKVKNNPE